MIVASSVRRGRWRFVASTALALLAASCSKPSESRAVADRFMELYYTRASVADAVKLCSGAARAKKGWFFDSDPTRQSLAANGKSGLARSFGS